MLSAQNASERAKRSFWCVIFYSIFLLLLFLLFLFRHSRISIFSHRSRFGIISLVAQHLRYMCSQWKSLHRHNHWSTQRKVHRSLLKARHIFSGNFAIQIAMKRNTCSTMSAWLTMPHQHIPRIDIDETMTNRVESSILWNYLCVCGMATEEREEGTEKENRTWHGR